MDMELRIVMGLLGVFVGILFFGMGLIFRTEYPIRGWWNNYGIPGGLIGIYLMLVVYAILTHVGR